MRFCAEPIRGHSAPSAAGALKLRGWMLVFDDTIDQRSKFAQCVGKVSALSPVKAGELAEAQIIQIETERAFKAGRLTSHIVS